MKFTKIPTTAFQEIQLNAGVLLSTFDPSSAEMTLTNIIGATSGGVTFESTPEFRDDGEDIDNCPKNMLELKRIERWEVKMSGTFVTVNPKVVKSLIGAADIASEKITPRSDLKADDFTDLWWVGDYSEKNSDTNGGFVAIHMLKSLSTGGFKLQSSDKAKGQFSFEYTAHYSMSAQTTVPFEVYVKAGTEPGVDRV